MKLNDKLRLVVVCLLATSAVAAYKVQTVPEMVKATSNLTRHAVSRTESQNPVSVHARGADELPFHSRAMERRKPAGASPKGNDSRSNEAGTRNAGDGRLARRVTSRPRQS